MARIFLCIGILVMTLAAQFAYAQAQWTQLNPPAGPITLTADIGQLSTGAEVRHSNGSAGIGIGWGGIYAVGSASNLDVTLLPKGFGKVNIGPTLGPQPLLVKGDIGQVSGGAEIMHSNGTAGIGIGWGGMYSVGSTTNLDLMLMPKGTGKVSIGPAAGTTTQLIVNGPITSTVGIAATYQDVAEWVTSTTHMPPGTVVVLNPNESNEVMPSSYAYDTAVAGVVSEQPGIILGLPGEQKEMIATTGRVKARVDATRRPIRVGDLLVTSDRPGMAMASEPIEIGGAKLHRPGTLVGKALEPLASGQGEILVLLSLQ